MRGHLYDAAGNRILWLDLREKHHGDDAERQFDRVRSGGYELSQEFHLGQDLTAVLFSSPRMLRALFWNPDGSFEMTCGNAVRCLAHFVDEDHRSQLAVSVETPCATYLSRKVGAHQASVVIPAETVCVAGPAQADLLVDVGTPHRLRMVDREWPEEDIVDAITYSNSPEPVNFSLVHTAAAGRYRARTFERGAGETRSCGTAALSIVAALRNPSIGSMTPETHRVQFASGELLTVAYDPAAETYEVGGRVHLLQSVEG